MAITFPRDLPGGLASLDFDLVRAVHAHPERGGAGPVLEAAEPYWRARYGSPLLTAARIGAWRAWWNSLRGGMGTIRAHDVERPYPVEHQDGDFPAGFDGTGVLVSAENGEDGNVLVLAAPAGLRLREGDYVSFSPVEGTQRLHMVLEDADSADGQIAITVDPHIADPGDQTGQPYTLVRPWCVMRPVPGSWSAPRARGAQPISFEARQVLF